MHFQFQLDSNQKKVWFVASINKILNVFILRFLDIRKFTNNVKNSDHISSRSISIIIIYILPSKWYFQ